MKSNTVYIQQTSKGVVAASGYPQVQQSEVIKSTPDNGTKKYIQVTVLETRRAIIHAELPEEKTAIEIQHILSDAAMDWYRFEKDSETIDLETTVVDFSPNKETLYLAKWNRLHETEGE
jgi:hypothetical protein